MKRIITIMCIVALALFSANTLYAVEVEGLEVGNGSGNLGDPIQVTVTLTNAGTTAPLANIAGAAFTVVTDPPGLELINVESDFFDTFDAQFTYLGTTNPPDPPTADGYDKGLVQNPVSSTETMIAAARASETTENDPNLILFTLTFQAMDTAGDYYVNIKPNNITNADAGYPTATDLDILMAADPAYDPTAPEAFTVVIDNAVNVGTGYSTHATGGVVTVSAGIVDTDADGMDDAWEITYFGNLTTAGPGTDFDQDGYLDTVEHDASTDPTVQDAPGGVGYDPATDNRVGEDYGMVSWGDGDLAVIFTDYPGYNGLWSYDGSAFTKVTDFVPAKMIAFGTKLAVVFTDYGQYNGLWSYDGSAFTKITDFIPSDMEAFGTNNLAVVFTDYSQYNGIWSYSGTFTKITDFIPSDMVAFSSSLAVVFTNYGQYNGIWSYSGAFSKVTDFIPSDMEAFGTNLAVVFTDYGQYNGIWSYSGTFTKVTDFVPSEMIGFGSDLGVVFTDYPGYNGIWKFSGAFSKITDFVPSAMEAWGAGKLGIVFTDYGQYNGIWSYSGTFSKITDFVTSRMEGFGNYIGIVFSEYGQYNGLWGYESSFSNITSFIPAESPPVGPE